MSAKYFGTDGIRGRVGKYPITADFFLKLGFALGRAFVKYQAPRVIIGKDTRASGYLFESALEAGLLSAGVDVDLTGPIPTPAIAYLTKSTKATAGVMISASHNTYEDNGVKVFSRLGAKLDDDDQKMVEEMLVKNFQSVGAKNIGKARRFDRAVENYIEFCQSSVERDLDLSPYKIVVDCANGATYHIAGKIFAALGAQISMIHHRPNGFNINKNCGSTHLQSLRKNVLDLRADFGIAFDGDGDRLMMVDHLGKIIDGDVLLFIIAKSRQSQKRLKNQTVVGTLMTNFGVRQSLENLGMRFIEADVGDRFVAEAMAHHRAILGGEGSGHIICGDKTTTGDGIISALEVLAALAKSGKNLSALAAETQKFPQALVNVAGKNLNLKAHQNIIRSVEEKLGNNGRVLIRKSGTEALVRVMVEAEDAALAEKSAKILAADLQKSRPKK